MSMKPTKASGGTWQFSVLVVNPTPPCCALVVPSLPFAPPHHDFLWSPIGFEDLVEYRRADFPFLALDQVQVLIHASIKFVLALFGLNWGFLQVGHRGLYYQLRSLPLPPFRHLVANYLHSTDL